MSVKPYSGVFHVVNLSFMLPFAKVVASYYGASGQVVIEGDIHWPTDAEGPPPDTPFCGFENENPLCGVEGKRYSPQIMSKLTSFRIIKTNRCTLDNTALSAL